MDYVICYTFPTLRKSPFNLRVTMSKNKSCLYNHHNRWELPFTGRILQFINLSPKEVITDGLPWLCGFYVTIYWNVLSLINSPLISQVVKINTYFQFFG